MWWQQGDSQTCCRPLAIRLLATLLSPALFSTRTASSHSSAVPGLHWRAFSSSERALMRWPVFSSTRADRIHRAEDIGQWARYPHTHTHTHTSELMHRAEDIGQWARYPHTHTHTSELSSAWGRVVITKLVTAVDAATSSLPWSPAISWSDTRCLSVVTPYLEISAAFCLLGLQLQCTFL